MTKRHGIPAGAILIALAACSTPDTPGDVHDPYEGANRVSHAFNKGADTLVFRPASQVYGHVVPEPARRSLSNAASNLDAPRSVVNHAFQGDAEDAIHTTFRFLINTTVGIFGLFDPAIAFGLEPRRTGFGDTLAVWGTPEGAYVELPLFGPSTERDAVGQFVDVLANPIGFMGDDGEEISATTSIPSVLNSRYEFAETVDGILYDSADSYAQLRLFYLESRRFELSGQGSAGNAFDPYEDLYDEVYEGLYDEFRRP
ncbi:MAG: VacJ family lipoprotein [Silicimonas sp.]|nr:VacJ family lipoprotein [Silicimonas sp.]NNF90080.1 VacJ family lipoprotein [Boseongicola sp.]RZW06016.1 MAG: VacJ family lipoprotein [Paracoccaceae bacterium]MBT8424799.1 VacJ family lipoprotein [Silicimonas sp.]NND17546.1 VacJ family lipoprotein [Silicimonas sp.]